MILGTISLSHRDALDETRRKLLMILSVADSDAIRTQPFLCALSDTLRWYCRLGRRPAMDMIFQPAVAFPKTPARLLFRLRADVLDEPLPNHLRLFRCEDPLANAACAQSPESELWTHQPSEWDEIKGFALPRNPLATDLEKFAAIFAELSREQLFDAVQEQKSKSEKLLHNILPTKIAEMLKNQDTHPGTIFDYHPSTTIVFTDEVGFTSFTKALNPGRLVKIIDSLFSRFDGLCDRHGVEKIKTIGDAYLAVAGVPEPMENHAQRAASLALGMLKAHREVMMEQGLNLEIRIGLHSGPLVAGVIGKRKYAYDIWGDSVNVASRMESTSLPGEIQISADTRQLLPPEFAVEHRGQTPIKGRGTIDTYFLRPQ
jgi:class 3 adenylate cyclase